MFARSNGLRRFLGVVVGDEVAVAARNTPAQCSELQLTSFAGLSNSHHAYSIHKRELILDRERVGERG
jgi:hypothetical protein